MQQTNKYTSIKYVYQILILYNMFLSLLRPSSGCPTRIRTIYKQLHKNLIKITLCYLIEGRDSSVGIVTG